jgi:tRNA uridine 5-carboxymethylaminomethyl modification enzyme
MPERVLYTEVIVIGGGHAGCEAALAAARLGTETVLLTINADHIAQMSCNPAIGGIAKGQVVREVDALGGEMGVNTDASCIQFRMLNRSKGPAVLSPRAQCDKIVYQRRMKEVLEREPNLRVHQASAVKFITDGDRVTGVQTHFGDVWQAKAVVVATGTFLAAKLHYGLSAYPGGRAGDPAAEALAASLREDLELEIGRLKTGTPPRVLADSIDFSKLERQDPDAVRTPFSFRNVPSEIPGMGGSDLRQMPCYTTSSTDETAQIIRDNLDKSPLYSGRIEGIGTRYCPSFEDKVVRFPQHKTHLIHLEPEGAFTGEYYLNGISTSFPVDIQWRLVRSLPGLAQAHISRYAYAIEYDFVFPHQLDNRLCVRRWPNLFLAGQINGTSGYEEAAGQGLVAGVNAARTASGDDRPFTLARDQAYIGVMIDDLVTKDITEPYRLFTSRAEHRLLLRQDNADLRLSRIGYEAGLLPESEFRRVEALAKEMRQVRNHLETTREQGATLWERLRRSDCELRKLPGVEECSERAAEQLEIEAKYEGYIKRESARAESMQRLEHVRIPQEFDYSGVKGLRNEARFKLEKVRPSNLSQASRIDGVTPAEIGLLQVFLKR